jgi:hypothetical protein
MRSTSHITRHMQEKNTALIYLVRAKLQPSPWGEGRDEGERKRVPSISTFCLPQPARSGSNKSCNVGSSFRSKAK